MSTGAPAEPPQVYAGAKAEQRTAKTVNRRRYGLLRELELDVRLVARVEPRGRGARVYSDAIYVATKTVQRLRKGGVVDELVDRDAGDQLSVQHGVAGSPRAPSASGLARWKACRWSPSRRPS